MITSMLMQQARCVLLDVSVRHQCAAAWYLISDKAWDI
jgi:hypothetical protein